MEAASFPLLFAAVVGVGHAFEADHLVAVSSIVSKRDRLRLAVKDGIYWGLGHSSTILLIGLIIILGKLAVVESHFTFFEFIVGLMLIALGGYRLHQLIRHGVAHNHKGSGHNLAYGVGLVHGLAGSGAIVLLVLSEMTDKWSSVIYLMVFGFGSIIGMLLAAGLFSLPFSKKAMNNTTFKKTFILISAILCIGYGLYVCLENS